MAFTHIAVVCIDWDRQTDEFITPWIEAVKSSNKLDTKYVFALNKIDLEPQHLLIETMKTRLEQKYHVPVILTSAKTGETIPQLFQLIEEICENLAK